MFDRGASGAAVCGRRAPRSWRAARLASRVPASAAAVALSGACLLACSGRPLAAQNRWHAGGALTLAIPQGEFANNVDTGLGLGGHLVYGLDPAGVVGLRVDGAFVTYGSERFRTPLSRTVSRILVDVRTRNNIFMLGTGPQLALPGGALRPYVNAAVGLGYFYTESSVDGSANFAFDDFARTTNWDDLSFGYGLGGGLGIGLRRGRVPLYLALDLQYRHHGETRYLREGSITEDGAGRVFIDPLRSEADLLIVQLGVSVGF